MGGQVTAYIDVDEVIEQLSDKDLLAEINDRGITVGPKLGGEFSDRDLENIREYVAEGNARDLLALMQDCLGFNWSPVGRASYDKLQRDPVSGRPVIQ